MEATGLTSQAPSDKLNAVDLTRCKACGRWCTLRPLACPECGSCSLGFQRASGKGKVKSLTVVHRAPDPQWREKVPYVVVLVNTDEGPVVMGHAASDVRLGDCVVTKLFDHGEQQLVRFVKADCVVLTP